MAEITGEPTEGWTFHAVPDQHDTLVADLAILRGCPLVPAPSHDRWLRLRRGHRRAASRGHRVKIHWFLPTGGDSREVLPVGASRRTGGHPTTDYLAQVAVACDHLGYDAMLTPCGTGCEDAWLATASLLPLTRRVEFLVAFRPALLTPTLAAQMASTYQRMSGGRLLVNIVTGAEAAELARFGVHDDKDTRYAQTAEFLQVMRGAWVGRAVRLRRATSTPSRARRPARSRTRSPRSTSAAPPPRRKRSRPSTSTSTSRGASHPRWWPSGSSGCAALAAAAGRTLRFGIRFHVIARPTAAEAWAFADSLVDSHGPRRDRGRTAGLRRDAVGRASSAWPSCTAATATGSSSTRTCGRASAWCAAASAPRSSASYERGRRTHPRVPRRSASTSSSSPATRTSRRRTGSARASCRSCGSRAISRRSTGRSRPVFSFR